MRNSPGIKLWQRNYFEHIIRNGNGLNRIRQYIADNPARWEIDRENLVPRNAKATRKTMRKTMGSHLKY